MKEKKLAFVVGGTKGIGASVAVGLMKQGYRVVVAARHEVGSADSGIDYFCMDVSQLNSVGSIIEKAVARWGVPDLLVNSAAFARGFWVEDASMLEIGNSIMQTNFFGTKAVVESLLPHFISRRSGHIVNISSMAGFLGVPGYSAYCASKYAVIGYSECLRNELYRYGIRVQVLCPPNTQTPGLEETNKTLPPEVKQAEEKAKTLDPHEVAGYLLKRLSTKDFLIIPHWQNRFLYRLSCWIPLVSHLVLRLKPVSK